ncbi:expressed unknown protein [Seminavis robusta]|uniref:Uncharacterized protein n=1 Tax=Seminavis robusta TaxID=568900 RepID=A0A9N8EUU5_9STRA|nr:expressed unknown protein [Seminavis robusta]|eukprot:Sro1636_g287540.1 n/a (510) ;mRNA; f:2976-4505
MDGDRKPSTSTRSTRSAGSEEGNHVLDPVRLLSEVNHLAADLLNNIQSLESLVAATAASDRNQNEATVVDLVRSLLHVRAGRDDGGNTVSDAELLQLAAQVLEQLRRDNNSTMTTSQFAVNVADLLRSHPVTQQAAVPPEPVTQNADVCDAENNRRPADVEDDMSVRTFDLVDPSELQEPEENTCVFCEKPRMKGCDCVAEFPKLLAQEIRERLPTGETRDEVDRYMEKSKGKTEPAIKSVYRCKACGMEVEGGRMCTCQADWFPLGLLKRAKEELSDSCPSEFLKTVAGYLKNKYKCTVCGKLKTTECDCVKNFPKWLTVSIRDSLLPGETRDAVDRYLKALKEKERETKRRAKRNKDGTSRRASNDEEDDGVYECNICGEEKAKGHVCEADWFPRDLLERVREELSDSFPHLGKVDTYLHSDERGIVNLVSRQHMTSQSTSSGAPSPSVPQPNETGGAADDDGTNDGSNGPSGVSSALLTTSSGFYSELSTDSAGCRFSLESHSSLL